MTDTLSKLFGSAARVKLLRLFLFNPGKTFTASEAAERTQVDDRVARSELAAFASIDLLRRTRRGKVVQYWVHEGFSYIASLRALLLNMSARDEEIRKRLRATGTIKLIVLSGIFVGDWEQAIDVLVVGDKMRDRAFKTQIQKLEAEIGREVHYALLSTSDFFYRLNMSDKLIRDIFDFGHRIVLDKFDIGLK